MQNAAPRVERREVATLILVPHSGFKLKSQFLSQSPHSSSAPCIGPTDPALERQVVVLLIQRPRELLELSAGLLGLVGRARTHRGSLERVAATTAASTLAAAEEEDFAHVDLGDVARLLLLVLELPVLDAPFHIELVALVDVALDDVGEAGALAARVPGDALVPFGLFLLLAGRRVPLARGRKRKVRDFAAVVRRTDFGIVPEIPDESDFVQAAAHNSSSNSDVRQDESSSCWMQHQFLASLRKQMRVRE